MLNTLQLSSHACHMETIQHWLSMKSYCIRILICRTWDSPNVYRSLHPRLSKYKSSVLSYSEESIGRMREGKKVNQFQRSHKPQLNNGGTSFYGSLYCINYWTTPLFVHPWVSNSIEKEIRRIKTSPLNVTFKLQQMIHRTLTPASNGNVLTIR